MGNGIAQYTKFQFNQALSKRDQTTITEDFFILTRQLIIDK